MTEHFTFNVSKEGPVATVDLHGEIDLGCVDMLTDEVCSYLNLDSVEHVFIDIHDVTFIDSCGIGGLIRCKNRSLEAGKRLQIVGDKGWVADTLQLSGVRDYLTQPGTWEDSGAA